jgi:membrane protein DedA with SNARE-associated domain
VTSPDSFAPEPEDAGYRPRPERSIAALLADLANEIRTLFRLEVALFKAELAEKLRRLGHGLIALAIGAFLIFSGWIALLATAALALAMVVPPWLAALLVASAALLAGALLLYLGKRWLLPESLVPRRTLNSLRKQETAIGERR